MTAMLDRSSAARMVAQHPQLFHVVYRSDFETRRSIAENGLAPGTTRHYWHGLYFSRPGHVYLASADYLSKVRGWGCRDYPVDVYAVATESLASSRVNPDEDWFRSDDWAARENMIGERQACQVFRLPFPPTMWMWDWAQHLGMARLPSYGEWADAVDLGSDPRQTAYSLQRGSVAYRGDIGPTALRHVFSSAGLEAK